MLPEGTIPLAPSAGVTVKPVPPQLVAVIALITGFGFTVTVTLKAEPTQVPVVPEVGVTLYVAVATPLPVFINVPVMLPGVPLLAAPPEKPEPVGADQE